MYSKHTLKLSNDFAPEYDKQIANSHWKGPEVIFDLLKNHIKPNQTLLDFGIGTGLASLPFYNAGVEIYGIDGSTEMLEICKSKNFAKQLILSDLCEPNLPFSKLKFDYVISNGVFHMVGDISHIIKHASRILKDKGFLCFTVIPFSAEEEDGYKETEIPGIYKKLQKESNLMVFRHTKTFVKNVLLKNKLQLINNQVFLALNNTQEKLKVFFEYFLAIKEN